MSTSLILTKKVHDFYGAKFVIASLLIFLAFGYTNYYLIENYFANSFLNTDTSKQDIYFLKSHSLDKMFEKETLNVDEYQKRVTYFKDLSIKNNFKPLDLYIENLKSLKKDSIVIGLDMMSLTTDEMESITNFVNKGGKLIFNYTSGFLDSSFQFRKNHLVNRIAGLSLNPNANTLSFKANEPGFMSTRLLSPITTFLPKGMSLDFTLYDPLPLFITPKTLDADAYLTNWLETNYMHIDNGRELSTEESGVLWHGTKGNGKWVYFSFPSYVFLGDNPKEYENLFKGMLNYLKKKISIMPYTYIDTKNAIFVSEDTEYRYPNFKQFSDVSRKNHFPVTAFCVASLAEENNDLTKKVSKNKYIEIASHSFDHKKIVGESDEVYRKNTIGSKESLDKIIGHGIIGFRPPREEVDEKMIMLLKDGGFKYIFNERENRLAPYYRDGIMVIPRVATDDYSYLINLDWDSEHILQEMIHQANVLVNLNGIFTMSVHTHLMAFGSNISIIDKFFKYVNSQKHMVPMNGAMIYERLDAKRNMSVETTRSTKNFIVTFNNDNPRSVKNVHYEIIVDPNIKITSVESEIIGVKTTLTQETKTKYILNIDSLQARSQIILFLNYDETY